jgi:AcrR family transcriptional regulator
MAKARSDVPPRTEGAEAVLLAALEVFAERGYHGTTVRQLAERQGLSVAALYYHFPSKRDVLLAIMTRAMDEIIRDTEAAAAAAPPDPVSQLSAIVRAHVLFHTRRPREGFVGNSELRSLEGADRQAILDRRDREEQIFRTVIDAGLAEGVFDIEHPRETARSILAACVAVHQWYRPDGPLSPEDVAERYVSIALQQVGAPSARRAGSLQAG